MIGSDETRYGGFDDHYLGTRPTRLDRSLIATGEVDSIDEAVRRCIDLAIVENALIEADDFAWSKPLVDEALAEVERGETISLDEWKA